MGSSPHTRGALDYRDRLMTLNRIIPAYAGSTQRRQHRLQGAQDHPRIRGEHERNPPEIYSGGGIIPAYAGSTGPYTAVLTVDEDHPRIRGEHCEKRHIFYRHLGSSPHTRGAPSQLVDEPPRARIIPAYAGSTGPAQKGALDGRDHPRIRGEHRIVPDGPTRRKGIIPAYAGSTGRRRVGYRRAPDHPRIRGEHTWKSLQYQGSPP